MSAMMDARLIASVLLCVVFAAVGHGQTPLGSGVTYQGRLTSGGSAYSGSVDVMGELFDAASGGNAVGTPAEVLGVSVADGVFSAEFDFGENVFGGQQRWLEVSVRGPSDGGVYTTLSPRQKITAAPQSQGPWAVVDGNAVFTGGRVGIGSEAPWAQLLIDGQGVSDVGLAIMSPGTSSGEIQFSSPNGVPGFVAYANNGNRRDVRFGSTGLNLVTSATGAKPGDLNGLFIGENGFLGLGTTSPLVRLDVRGIVQADSFAYASTQARSLVVGVPSFQMGNDNGINFDQGIELTVFEATQHYAMAAIELPEGATITGAEFHVRDVAAAFDANLDVSILRVSKTGNPQRLFRGGTEPGEAPGYVTLSLALDVNATQEMLAVDRGEYYYYASVRLGRDAAGGLSLVSATVHYTIDGPE